MSQFNAILVQFILILFASSSVLSSEYKEYNFTLDLLNKANQFSPLSLSKKKKFVTLGEVKSALPKECHPNFLLNQSVVDYTNALEFSKSVRQYFNHCEGYLKKGNAQGASGLINFGNISYDLRKNPQLKSSILSLSDGSKIESIIGVKDLIKKRPWVILKCGVFCDINQSAASLNFIINLFDQSPFNIILISNHTGIKHIKNNSTLLMGGYYESFDLFDVANWLRSESPYKDIIDSVHVFGFSLGGSSSLGVSYLLSHYNSQFGKDLINSSISVCPVVNLEPTMKDLFYNPMKSKAAAAVTWKYLKDAAPYLDKANDYLDRDFPPAIKTFPDMLAQITLRYGQEWELAAPPGRNLPNIDSLSEYYKRNNFSKYESGPEIPTLVWASVDDSLVSYKLNTKTLMDLPQKYNNLGVLALGKGNHCALDTAYGYSTITAVLQSFIINNSFGFKNQAELKSLDIPYLSKVKFVDSEIHLRQWWIAKENSSQLELNFETFDPMMSSGRNEVNCISKNPVSSPSSCRRVHRHFIPIDSLSKLGIRVPQNQTEAEILSRKLNINLRLSNELIPIDGTQLQPSHIAWRSY